MTGDLNITIDMRFKNVQVAMRQKADEFDGQVRRMVDLLTDLAYKWVKHEAPHKTGNLKSSTRKELKDAYHGYVWVSKSQAKYFDYVIDGTPAHVIVPKYKKALAWPGMSGGPYKRVNHPGTEKNPYIDKAFDHMMPEVDDILERFHYWLVNV